MVTPAQFKAAKPQFAAVPDETVQAYLTLSERFTTGDDDATILMTCHLMTLDGLGTDAASQSFVTGAAEYQSIRSGQLTLTRYQKAASTGSYGDWLQSTPCGRVFWQLIRATRGGPRVALGGRGGGYSYYAKDWPLFGGF